MTQRSHVARHASILLALVGLWLALSRSVLAAPGLPVPPGWAEGSAVDEQAYERAESWAAAWNGNVRQVMSPRSPDRFAETLAILDVGAPIPPDALTNIEVARAWLEPRVAAALGTRTTLDPERLELHPRPQRGVAVLTGRAQRDDLLALIAVAPTGSRHIAVVMLIHAADEVLYARLFEDAVAQLEGLQRPVAPFRRGLARGLALLAWLVVGGALAFEWTRRSLPLPGPRAAGRQLASVLLAAALVVLGVVGVLLGRATVELELVGTTPWSTALELAMGGAIMAVLVVVITELWERRLRPVASAPPAGSFALGSAASRRSDRVTPSGATPRPAITGDTHVGRPPAITGDTHVGRPPAVTGDTQVGRAPAVSGNTKVGPPPQPIPLEELDGGPPVREVISGDIEMDTQVRRMPEPDTVKTERPSPPSPTPIDLDEDTNPRVLPDHDEPPATLADPHDPPRRVVDEEGDPILDASLPKLEIDWS